MATNDDDEEDWVLWSVGLVGWGVEGGLGPPGSLPGVLERLLFLMVFAYLESIFVIIDFTVFVLLGALLTCTIKSILNCWLTVPFSRWIQRTIKEFKKEFSLAFSFRNRRKKIFFPLIYFAYTISEPEFMICEV